MDSSMPLPNLIRNRRRLHTAFSITEMLVVIAIIVLLAGLLVVAMGRVRAKSLTTSTLATMQSFASACDAFQTEHGHYPGVIPEQVLAQAIADGQISHMLTSTENAVLHLMGGYRVCPPGTPGCSAPGTSPMGEDFENFHLGPNGVEIEIGTGSSEWRLKIDKNRIGEGPIINGKPYAPYYTPGPHELRTVNGQALRSAAADDPELPDVIDAWGNPILYTRRLRSSGVLVWEPGDDSFRPQFVIDGMRPYIESAGLADRGMNQQQRSLLTRSESTPDENGANRYSIFAQIIRHPSLGTWQESPLHSDNRGRVAPRGEYVLISAGPDGVYFDYDDGPGGNPDLVEGEGYANPRVIESYDDILVFGGG